MNNTPDYLYAGVPRAPRSTRRLIIDLYAGNDLAVTKNRINQKIEERHTSLRGEPASEKGMRTLIGNALQVLPNADYRGTVEKQSYWRINRLELGTGSKWVYCFYFSDERNKAIRDRKWCWKCNIGRTSNNPFDRIRTQTSKASEDPIVPLLIRTEDETALEHHIHNTLKAERRHLQNTDTNEDFLTCPSEVAQIFFDSPYFSGERIAL